MACCSNQTNTISDLGLEERYICCCNERFTFNLTEVANNQYTLTCTPCSIPTAVFDVATITIKENSCNQIEYYQAAINTDPVEIIQDCSLKNLICRCITCYFSNITLPSCGNSRRIFSFI